MTHEQLVVAVLDSGELLASTRELARKSVALEADLIVHIGELNHRKLYLDGPFPSMFAFCVGELGFSDDAAYNRITVARAARRLPAILDALRSGSVHLAGLRLLAPHLTEENHQDVLREDRGKSKRAIEELVARLAPQPPAPDLIRKLPQRSDAAPARVAVAPSMTATRAEPPPPSASPAPGVRVPLRPPTTERRQAIQPLAEESYKVQFTAHRALRNKLREAQDLLRHRVPDGDLATIVESAIDLLIARVKKERFATERRPRNPAAAIERPAPEVPQTPASRRIPDAVKRAVYKRDGGRCTFMDDCGRRCPERGAIEFDHVDGYARTRKHSVDDLRLLCRAHNQRAADKMYGRAFMDNVRRAATSRRTRPGTSSPPGSVSPEPAAPTTQPLLL